MTWDIVLQPRNRLGPEPTLHRWSRDNPSPPHPVIVTENIVGSSVVGTATKNSKHNC